MKLTYDVLKRELSEHFGLDLTGFSRNCDAVDSVMIYHDNMDVDTQTCYIARQLPTEPSKFSGSDLLVIPDSIDMDILRVVSASTICYPADAEPADVVNAISSIFNKYNRWDDRMREILHQNGTVKDLLDASVPFFGNPLVVVDSAFRIAAAVGPEGSSEAAVSLYGEVVGKKEMDLIKEEFPRMRQLSEPMLRDLPGIPAALCMNMHDGSFYLGVVAVVESCRKLLDTDAFLLEKLTGSVRKAFLRQETNAQNDQYTVGYILSGLLAGKRYDTDQILRVIGSSGIRSGDAFRCMAIRQSASAVQEYITYFYSRLGRRLPTVYIPSGGEYSYALIDETWAGTDSDRCIKMISEELEQSGLRCGISARFTDITSLDLYAAQASQAARICAFRPGNVSLLSFEDCWLEYMLHACSGAEHPITLQPEGFRRLVEHDEKGARVSYVETLRAYLFNNNNALKAAQSLYISRNSFMSRWESVEKILDMDLEDPKVRFLLMYSLFSLEQ